MLYDNRSGSTLLSSLLNRYQHISVSQESLYIPRILEYSKPTATGTDIELLINHLYRDKKFSHLPFTRKELALRLLNLKKPHDKNGVIEKIVELHFDKIDREAEVCILKQPVWSYVDQIVEIFPSARFIHIIRDGRAVYHSKRTSISSTRNRRMDTNLLHAAKKWRFVLRTSEKYSSLVHQVKYEELVQNEDRELWKVLDYLNVPSEKRLKTKTKSDYFVVINPPEKHLHGNILKNGSRDITTRWKDGMRAAEVYLYEKVNGDDLKKYGYDLVYDDETTHAFLKIKAVLWACHFFLKNVMNNITLLIEYSLKKDVSIIKVIKRKWQRTFV